MDLHRSPVVSGHPTAALPRFPTRTALSEPSLHLRDPKRGWAERPDPARTASNVCGGREGALLSSCEVATRRLTARGPGPRVPPPAGSFILFFAFRVRVAPLVGTRRSPSPPPHLPASSAAFSGAGPGPPLPGRPAPRISFYSLGITRPRENSIPPLIRLILESSLRRKVTGTDKGLVGKPRHLTLVPRRPFSGADATLPTCPGCSPRPHRVLAAPADPGTTGDVLRLGGGCGRLSTA